MPQPNTPLADDAQRLRQHNLQTIDQALAVVAAHRVAGSAAFAGTVGAHLRHVIEHYDALLFPAVAGEVHYDRRARDRALEQDPALAHARLQAIGEHLAQHRLPDMTTPVRVHGVGGLAGELAFSVESTFGRELAFVAAHAVHHYALLQLHGLQNGIELGADFGKAPATVAFERDRATPSIPTTKDTPCFATDSAA